MKRWTIYCHTHIESGRRYVGLTSRTMERRWSQHVTQSKSSKSGRWHFPNAIRKYGPDAFEHKILETCDSLELANEREKHWVKEFDTINPLFGFNLAHGGSHTPHPIRKNPWINPEYREKQLARPNSFHTPQARANNKASLNTPESRAKRSALSKTSLNTPESRIKRSASSKAALSTPESRAKRSVMSKVFSSMLGKKHSKETIQKISDAQRGRTVDLEHRAKISITMTGRKLSTEHVVNNSRARMKSHCKYGHSRADAYIMKNGQRVCRQCSSNRRARKRIINQGINAQPSAPSAPSAMWIWS